MTADRRPGAGCRLAVVLVAAVVCAGYGVWAGYLALLAGEGELPPRWRIPEFPAGVHVASDTRQCASGGCWWDLVLRPAPEQSPRDLADEMGVVGNVRHPWHLLDPHSVEVGSHEDGETLRIYVRY